MKNQKFFFISIVLLALIAVFALFIVINTQNNNANKVQTTNDQEQQPEVVESEVNVKVDENKETDENLEETINEIDKAIDSISVTKDLELLEEF